MKPYLIQKILITTGIILIALAPFAALYIPKVLSPDPCADTTGICLSPSPEACLALGALFSLQNCVIMPVTLIVFIVIAGVGTTILIYGIRRKPDKS